MKKIFLALAMASFLTSACTTTKIKETTNNFTAVKNPIMLVLDPDVEAQAILVSGVFETRADWSLEARNNMEDALRTVLGAKSSNVKIVSLSGNLTSRQQQIIKLNDAVALASLTHDYGQTFKLPTKKDAFDRTIGPGAKALADGTGADYALKLVAAGHYNSTGGQLKNIASLVSAATIGVGPGLQFGEQTVFASLIDTQTGDVVWSNRASNLGGSDMRKPEGAVSLIEDVLKGFPL